MMAALERGNLLSRAQSVASPLSLARELTPQSSTSDPALLHISDQINQLDSRVFELRSCVLTKDAYVDRRNQQDEFIRREFDAYRAVQGKIETVVGHTNANVNQLQCDVNQLQLDIRQLHSNVSATKTDLEIIRKRMVITEQIRYNAVANTLSAPLRAVPVLDDDGTMRTPKYFPGNVWKFWCLKRKKNINRLIELAEFYQLEDYQTWGRIPYSHESIMMQEGGYLSDSSDSSDTPPDITRAEATRLYPEACHQALAATLGLVYYKIRNEAGEGPNQQYMRESRKRERAHDEISTATSAKRQQKPPRRPEVSPNALRKLVTDGTAFDAASIVSEGLDQLGWNINGSQMSDEKMNILKDMVTDQILKAFEGRLKSSSSHQDQSVVSPTGSAKRSERSTTSHLDIDEDMHTVSTEVMSPTASREADSWSSDQPSNKRGP